MNQPADHFNVRVHVICGCGAVQKFCVPVDKQMPNELRCSRGTPARGGGGGDGGGAIRCPNGHACGIGLSELRERALRELEQGRGRHIREGAVILDCP